MKRYTLLNHLFVLAALSALVSLAPGIAFAQDSGKKLIELGWDIPDPAFMRKNVARMEQAPFDGCIFFANYQKPDGTKGNLSREIWSKTEIPDDTAKPLIDDLKATPFHRFTDNFLRIDMMPANLSWYDDFGSVLHNFRLAARIAKEGGVKGIFLDTEQYGGRLFDSIHQHDRKSYVEYEKQVRQRGKEIIDAIQDVYPDVTILLSHAHSLVWIRSDDGKKRIAGSLYDLLPSFVDGMIDGARGNTVLVDAFEPAYYLDDPGQFETAYQTVKTKVRPIVANPSRYAEHISVGFGLWLDRDWDKRGGWNEKNLSANYFSPDKFQQMLTRALKRSDKYVWIYSQKVNWWTGKSLPPAYVEAIRKAHEGQ